MIYRDAHEQHWRDYDEGLHDPDLIVERERDLIRDRAIERATRLREAGTTADMSWPPADIAVERVRRARAAEPRRFARATWVEWVLMTTGIALVVAWVLFLLALLVIVSAP